MKLLIHLNPTFGNILKKKMIKINLLQNVIIVIKNIVLIKEQQQTFGRISKKRMHLILVYQIIQMLFPLIINVHWNNLIG